MLLVRLLLQSMEFLKVTNLLMFCSTFFYIYPQILQFTTMYLHVHFFDVFFSETDTTLYIICAENSHLIKVSVSFYLRNLI